MKNRFFKSGCLILSIVVMIVWTTPASAISIKEEEDLAREFMKLVASRFDLIEDPLIVGYVDRIGRAILAQLPSQPFEFHFYVINEEVYNAFALPAGHIFINSGLLTAMQSEEELAGILSHEIAHVVCRHISQRIERSKKINVAALAGVFAGIFLGAAGADGNAMSALSLGSMAAGQSAALAYSREDEAQADQLGLDYLNRAGYKGQGLLTVLKKIRSRQWFGSEQIPNYMMTHPAIEERIASIDTAMAVKDRHKSPGPAEKAKSTVVADKIGIRLKALYGDRDAALNHFQNAIAAQPQDPAAAYGYGLVLAREGKRDQAVTYLRQALSRDAFNPVILSDLGRVYFLNGRYQDALNTLEGAVSLKPVNPEGLFYLGRTRMEVGAFDKAVDAFEAMLELTPDYRPVYQFLGESYGKLDRLPEAHYFLGLFHFKTGDLRVARHHLIRAQKSMQDPSKLEKIKKTLDTIGKIPEEKPA